MILRENQGLFVVKFEPYKLCQIFTVKFALNIYLKIQILTVNELSFRIMHNFGKKPNFYPTH